MVMHGKMEKITTWTLHAFWSDSHLIPLRARSPSSNCLFPFTRLPTKAKWKEVCCVLTDLLGYVRKTYDRSAFEGKLRRKTQGGHSCRCSEAVETHWMRHFLTVFALSSKYYAKWVEKDGNEAESRMRFNHDFWRTYCWFYELSTHVSSLRFYSNQNENTERVATLRIYLPFSRCEATAC